MTIQEDFRNSMNARLTNPANTTEGGFSQDIIGSVAYELANVKETQIDPLLDNAFISTADAEHLKLKGEDLGLPINPATRAFVEATITGAAEGAIVDDNIKALADELVFYSTEYRKVDDTGNITVKMRCETAGSIGNIAIGTLNKFLTTYVGFENAKITNLKAGFDGFNEEDIETYRRRLLDTVARDPINSNIDDYIKWAKSIAGVQKVVVDDAFIAGAGNVNVHISAVNEVPVSSELIQEVTKYIKQEQIINANVTVDALEYLNINTNATLKLADGVSVEDIKAKYTILLHEYFGTVTNTVSYLRISDILFSIDGVEDVTALKVNNDNLSISVGRLQVAKIGEVQIVKG